MERMWKEREKKTEINESYIDFTKLQYYPDTIM